MSVDPHDKEKLKTLYRALKERPLDLADAADAAWYVPYARIATNNADPIREIVDEITFSDAQSLHYVTGQRGTGKSTELLRLRKELQEKGVIVLYVDMLDYLHMAEPAEISDFLVAVSAGLANQAREDHGLDIEEGYWESIRNFFNRLDLQFGPLKASLKLPPVAFGTDLSAKLKADSSFKKQLQDAMRGYTDELVEQIHLFAAELVKALRYKHNDPDLQVAVIVDSFEQIRGYYGNVEQVHKSVLRLFGADGKWLWLPLLHTIITVPPYLSSATDAGLTPVSLPTVHVRQSGTNAVDERGVQVMLDMVYNRSAYASEIFTDETLRELVIASGGDIRDYFLMVKSVLVKAGSQLVTGFPVNDALIEQAKDRLRSSMMPIDDVSTRWLFKVQATKRVELEDQQHISELAQLFDRHFVIHYKNGDDWYDIHPLITDYVLERQQELDERDAQSQG